MSPEERAALRGPIAGEPANMCPYLDEIVSEIKSAAAAVHSGDADMALALLTGIAGRVEFVRGWVGDIRSWGWTGWLAWGVMRQRVRALAEAGPEAE